MSLELRPIIELARKYGVSESTISYARRGITYGSVK